MLSPIYLSVVCKVCAPYSGVVDWGCGVFASCCRGSNCSLAHAMDGRISAAAPLALADQLPLPMIVKRGWSGFPVRHAI